MAHEMIHENGKTYAAFGREHAWHKLGHHAGHLMTVDEAKTVVDWHEKEVSEHALFLANGQESSKGKAIIANDGTEIAVVGKDWQLLNNESFMGIIGGITNGADAIDSIGILNDGARIFASLASEALPKSKYIAGDEYKPFLTMLNAHNATMRFMIFFSLIRTVCANTWKASLSARKADDTIFARKHTKNMSVDIDLFVSDFHKSETKAQKEMEAFAEKVEFLHSRQFSELACRNILADILGVDLSAKKESTSTTKGGKERKPNERAENRFNGLLEFVLEQSDTNYDSHLTGKRILDAVIEAVDFGNRAFVPRNTQGMGVGELQANYALFGAGQGVKDKAMDIVLEYAQKEGSTVIRQQTLFSLPSVAAGVGEIGGKVITLDDIFAAS